jgi:DHA1 family multidrug resistance protein-like MFS transporter/DHA1 family quinolone resistance protein-like MFS transporter
VENTDHSTSLRFPAWIGLFVTFTVMGTIITVFPMYARDALGLGKSTIGALLLGRGLFTAAGYLIIGRTTFWHFKAAPMTIGLALLTVLVLCLAWLRSVAAVAICLALIGPFIALGFSYSFFHGASGAVNRATRMAIHEALLASGLICGSAAGGQIYQYYSMKAVSVFCAALMAVAIGAQVILVRLARGREKQR